MQRYDDGVTKHQMSNENLALAMTIMRLLDRPTSAEIFERAYSECYSQVEEYRLSEE